MIEWRDYIERNDGVMIGKPVFKGTRITVERVLELISGGKPWNELVRGFPLLRQEHLTAACLFAAEVSRSIRSSQAMPPAERPRDWWDDDDDVQSTAPVASTKPAVAGR